MRLHIKIILLLLFLGPSASGFSQTRDTILVTATREKELDGQELYTVTLKNWSQTPVCILHSTFINLFDNPPQRMAVFRETDSLNLYSLEYCARDTGYDYEGPINNFNAEIILPLQQITFSLLLPKSGKQRKLKFEYAWIENFCYPAFKEAIFKDATEWYKKYKRIEQAVDLP